MISSHKLQASASELMALARRQTGIDIDDAAIAEELERYVQALNTEAALSERGAQKQQEVLLLLLCNRLRMFRDLQAHPEIEQQVINGPIVISGTARTGSTKLQKLLAASGDFQWLPFWQALCPSLLSGERAEDSAARVAIADQQVRWLHQAAPASRNIHEFSTLEAEEENLLLTHKLYGIYLNAFAFVPSYVQWYMQQRDPLDDFRFLKLTLQYLQWQFRPGDARPWLLKAPSYPGLEPAFVRIFPSARFVTPHRDPLATVASAMSLVSSLYEACSDNDFREILGKVTPFYLAQGKVTQAGVQAAHPEIPWLDVSYKDITAQAERVIEQIYGFAGMPLSAAARAAMQNWEAQNRQHKHGAHRYAVADYGLDEAAIAQLFAEYTAKYSAYL